VNNPGWAGATETIGIEKSLFFLPIFYLPEVLSNGLARFRDRRKAAVSSEKKCYIRIKFPRS
jgi:hypothetical protein